MAAADLDCASQVRAAEGVATRLLGSDHPAAFECIAYSDSADPVSDQFELQTIGGKLMIRGTSGVAMAFGLHFYLKHYAGLHVSWGDNRTGCNLRLPTEWPAVDVAVRRSGLEVRQYLNPCTFSYSAWNWGWGRWEQEIDWMALQGINAPLAFTGAEWVWSKVYQRFGLEQDELDGFFVGPAFLAWGRMGNLKGWGGG